MATVLFQNRFRSKKQTVDHFNFGKKVGIIAKIFGCGHANLSRPFSQGKVGYRTCLHCGARKSFDPTTLRTFGDFYYPQINIAE